MADFDLIQTDAQVQSILNDGQSAMGASAQTTLTTEYVMLKDTNGVYHKILKSSFTEAIRDTLAGLLVNNDKGTTINQIAAIASGDFGSITPANLASVLGGNKRGRVDATQSTNMKAVIPNDVSGNSGFLIYAVYGRSYNIGVCTFEFNGGITTLKAGFGTVDYTNNELSITLPGTTKGTVDYVIYSFSG